MDLTGPFQGSEALRAGALTRGRLFGPRFRRIFPDVYAPSDLADDLALRSSAAHLLVRGLGGVLAGYSAALLLGADCAPAGAPAEVLVTRKVRPRPGLVVWYGTAAEADIIDVGDTPVTSPPRTAWDLCRRLSVVDAVVALDALARVGRFGPAQLLDRRRTEPGARGCGGLVEIVALADPRAESPPESRLRLQLLRAGLPPPEVQYRIRDEHGFVLARVYLAGPEARLAIEYDGWIHYGRQRGEADKQRNAELATHGWLTVRLGRHDVGAAQTPYRIRNILRSRSAPAGAARW